jgi:hypothetical protein
MAAKKTVFLNQDAPIREVRQTEVNKLKDAFRIVMRDYLRMKLQQTKFESSLEMFCMKISPWTIPRKRVETWIKGIRATGTVRKG